MSVCMCHRSHRFLWLLTRAKHLYYYKSSVWPSLFIIIEQKSYVKLQLFFVKTGNLSNISS